MLDKRSDEGQERAHPTFLLMGLASDALSPKRVAGACAGPIVPDR